MPTLTEWIRTFRTFSTTPTVVDTMGIDDRSPGLKDLGRAQLSLEAAPFAALTADIDRFFGDDIDDFFGGDPATALTGPEAAQAADEVRRIISEHLTRATTRLAVGTAVLPRDDWATATNQELYNVAHAVLQRAADLRFVEVVTPAATAA